MMNNAHQHDGVTYQENVHGKREEKKRSKKIEKKIEEKGTNGEGRQGAQEPMAEGYRVMELPGKEVEMRRRRSKEKRCRRGGRR